MRLFAYFMVSWLATNAAMAEPKPVFSIKTKTIEASAVIDDKLAAYPKLRNEILADAKRALQTDQQQAGQELRSSPKYFRPWSVARGYTLRTTAGPFVSVLVTDFSYSGGAHPNTVLTAHLWNNETGRMAGLDALLDNPSDSGATLRTLAGLIRRSLAAEKKARDIEIAGALDDDPDLKRVEPKIDAIGAPSLAPSTVAGKAAGLTFHFSPGDVGANVEGSYVAFISWKELEPLLRPQVRPLFAGARPDSDAER